MSDAWADASRYEILFDLKDGEYSGAGVGGIRTKTIRAGDSLEVECFPITKVGEAARRECLRRGTRPGQAAVNRRNAEKRIRRLLETNFRPGDFALHGTWDYGAVDRDRMGYADAMRLWEAEGLPLDEDDARRAVVNYLRRVKRAMRRRGQDPRALKYLYVLESTREPRDTDPMPLPPRFHFHMAISAPGLSRDELEALWPHGFCNCDRLSFRGNGLAALAAYVTKQNGVERLSAARPGERPRKLRRWACSRNLKEPTVTVSDRKVSRRRAALVAADVAGRGVEIFERLYPGYRCAEPPTVRYSDFIAGAYIFARLRRIDPDPPWKRRRE